MSEAKQQRVSYLNDLSNFASDGAISDEDGGAGLNALGKSFVRAGDSLVVSLDRVISHDQQLLSCSQIHRLVVSEHTSSDLRALSVQHDSASLVGSLLQSLLNIIDSLTMGLLIL